MPSGCERNIFVVRKKVFRELAQGHPRVALALHNARRSTPVSVRHLLMSAAAARCSGAEK